MLINEVCKECGLTKKAIEYYEALRLIQPKVLENGYRDFSKQELADKLAKSEDWEYTRQQLEILEQKQTISERLLNVYPGYYGKYVSLHFASYLNEPITTKEQQEAFYRNEAQDGNGIQ